MKRIELSDRDFNGVTLEESCLLLGVEQGAVTVYGSRHISEVVCHFGVGFIAVPDVLLSSLEAWAVESPNGVVWSDGI